MNSKKVEALLKKYWDGDADQSEELELKKFFSSGEGASHADAVYFQYLDKKGTQNPIRNEFDEQILQQISESSDSGKSRSLSFRYWYVAASLAVITSVGIIFKSEIFKAEVKPEVVHIDTFEDPEKAFEETKKALLFLSSKLNQSNEYAAQLSKFEKGQEVLKQPPAAGTN